MFVFGGLAGAEPTDRRLRPIGDGWWERSYELARDVRTAYCFTKALLPSDGADLIPDPLNPVTHVYAADRETDDEELVVSLVVLPDAAPYRWSLATDGIARGETNVHRLASDHLGNERRVYTYVPHGYDPSCTYPFVVCFDGHAYVDDSYVPLPTVLDNLIAERAIPPVVAVLPDSLDSTTRMRELSLHEPFVEFLVDELLPWAHDRLSFDDDPSRTVVAGSSLGGLAAAFCGLHRPDVFGLVVSQSGAFQRGLASDFARAEKLPLRFWLDVGALETVPFAQFASLYHANVHLRDVLVAKGYDVSFRAFAGGHDYFWWRETVADGLVSLLGPS